MMMMMMMMYRKQIVDVILVMIGAIIHLFCCNFFHKQISVFTIANASQFRSVKCGLFVCDVEQILKGKLNLPPYLTNEARGLLKKVSVLLVMKMIISII